MKITQLEQSATIIETNKGFKIGIDIASYTPLEKLDGLKLDAMLSSHLHGDHFSVPHIAKLVPKKLYLNQECVDLLSEQPVSSEIIQVKIGDAIQVNEEMKITFFDVDHGPNTKVKPKENFGLLIEAEGQKFYPSGMDVKGLEVDYALIPVGTFYTFGPQEAFDLAKRFKKIGKVLPMHYEFKLETKGEFLKLAKEGGLNVDV